MTIYLRFGLLIMSNITDSIRRGYGRPDVHTRDWGEVVDLWIPLAMRKLFLLPQLTTTTTATTSAADIIILNDVNVSVVSTHSLQNVRRVGMTES
jgi:hypothetical protein